MKSVLAGIFYMLVAVDFLAVFAYIIENFTWIISISYSQLEIWDDAIIVLSVTILILHGVNVCMKRMRT